MARFMKRPSPAMVVSVIALVAAVAGSAIAGIATTSKLSGGEKKQVRKLATGVTKKLAYTKAAADGRFLTQSAADGRYLQSGQIRVFENKSTSILSNFDVGNFTDVLSDTVSVPTSGRLLIWANLTAEDANTGDSNVETRLLVDGTPVGVEVRGFVENSVDFYDTSTAPSAQVPVSAGDRTVTLQAFNGGDKIAILQRSITAVFIPSS